MKLVYSSTTPRPDMHPAQVIINARCRVSDTRAKSPKEPTTPNQISVACADVSSPSTPSKPLPAGPAASLPAVGLLTRILVPGAGMVTTRAGCSPNRLPSRCNPRLAYSSDISPHPRVLYIAVAQLLSCSIPAIPFCSNNAGRSILAPAR
jgi:hypothetical protein